MRSCVCFARGAVHAAGVLPLPGVTLALAPLPCVLVFNMCCRLVRSSRVRLLLELFVNL
jgi:hypothetical protein